MDPGAPEASTPCAWDNRSTPDKPGQTDTAPCLYYVAFDYEVAISYIPYVKQITYTKDALKALHRMPANTSKRIRDKIEAYASDPASQANNARALKGRDGIRLRIGDWRVIMHDGTVLAVLEIGPRGRVYDD